MLGIQFTAGEPLDGVRRVGWNNRRCGSLITAVVKGCSRYGIVSHFIERKDGRGDRFAVITWLSKPSYPHNPNPVVVRLVDDDLNCHLPVVLKISDIDPTSVGVSRCEREKCYYVYRMKGLDTIR